MHGHMNVKLGQLCSNEEPLKIPLQILNIMKAETKLIM